MYAIASLNLYAQSDSGYAIINGGLEMYYEIHGEGEPLVLLHGAFGTAEGWAQILPALTENRQVIAIELEGHGRTNDLDRPLSYRQMGPAFKGYSHEELRSIRAEVLIMMGDRDVARPEHAVELYRLIPNSQLAVYPNGDHFILWHSPDRILSDLLAFLDGQGSDMDQ